MRIEIEIPKEFEKHFEQDAFEDALYRLRADAHLLAGNYEKETATMLIEAFKNGKPAYDVDKVVEQMREEQEKLDTNMFAKESDDWYGQYCNGIDEGIDKAIEIVKAGETDEID